MSRLKGNIIFESNVLDLFECGTSCLDTRFCVGYNFKQSATNGQINCQLTNTRDLTFDLISTEDNDWTFFKTEEKRLVSILRFIFWFFNKKILKEESCNMFVVKVNMHV